MKIDDILNETDIKTKYSLALDYISDYLINTRKIYEMCDFNDDKCIANRLNKSVACLTGCCYQFRKGQCPHLQNKKCSIDSISCKLFICTFLEKKYGAINLKKEVPIAKIFNRKQLNIIKHSFFKDKSEIIELLVKYY